MPDEMSQGISCSLKIIMMLLNDKLRDEMLEIKCSDLICIGEEWKRTISFAPASSKVSPYEFAAKITKYLNNIYDNKITVIPNWFGPKIQLMIKSGRNAYSYKYFMDKFEAIPEATSWILAFLNEKIDMNYNYTAAYIHDVRAFVCITCMSEVARGYGEYCLDELRSFLEEIVDNKTYWRFLKNRYEPSLTYREDSVYNPETLENDIPYKPDRKELEWELELLRQPVRSISPPPANSSFPCSSSSFNSTKAFFL